MYPASYADLKKSRPILRKLRTTEAPRLTSGASYDARWKNQRTDRFTLDLRQRTHRILGARLSGSLRDRDGSIVLRCALLSRRRRSTLYPLSWMEFELQNSLSWYFPRRSRIHENCTTDCMIPSVNGYTINFMTTLAVAQAIPNPRKKKPHLLHSSY